MVILGLGTNLGDKLGQLRRALNLLQKIPDFRVEQVSPIYISDALLPENAPLSWDTPFLNLAIRCTTSLMPLELLEKIKKIEIKVGRRPEKVWGPRIIDIDILAWDDLIQFDDKLHIPHECLHERPFALWPLADVAPFWVYPLPGPYQGKTATEITAQWGSRFTGNAPFHTQEIFQRIDTPALMGIINMTPDSFSKDGLLGNPNAVISQVHNLVDSGAEIIDIGAEATGPNATPIDAETEWLRLQPVLEDILNARSNMLLQPKISIDTRRSLIAEKALHLGIDYINDVSGIDDIKMLEVLKNHTCHIVFMHHLGIPVSQSQKIPLSENIIPIVYEWAEKKRNQLEKNGISSQRLIFDIGIGFGKTAEQSLDILRHISEFKKLGLRLLVGHSRKSFYNLLTPSSFEERDIETITTSLFLAKEKIDFLRVHNVKDHARAFRVREIF